MTDTTLDPARGSAPASPPAAPAASGPPPAPPAPAPAAERPPRSPLGALRREIDRLFDDLGWSAAWPLGGGGRDLGAWDPFRDGWPALAPLPRMDLVEREAAFELRVDLPGLTPADVELRLADGLLTLEGGRTASREETEGGFHLRERSSGRFARSLRLPPGVDPERVEARFADGVLRVTLPKTEAARAGARRIAIAGA